MELSTREALPAGGVPVFYNEQYVTGFGVKLIQDDKRQGLIHDTNNLPFLIDGFFHKEAGQEARHLPEYVAYRKLEDSLVEQALRNVRYENPEVFELLAQVTAKRDAEYEARRLISERPLLAAAIHADSGITQPTQAEEYNRELLTSITLDLIGDEAWHWLDLNLLVK